MNSRPADLVHPSFDSLLDALRAVSEHRLPVEALARYYQVLVRECEAAQRELEKKLQQSPNDETLMFARGLWGMTRAALEPLPRYVQEPSRERMVECVTAWTEVATIGQAASLHLRQLAAEKLDTQ